MKKFKQTNKNTLTSALLLLAMLCFNSAYAEEAQTLSWRDLVPARPALQDRLRKEIDGTLIRIRGFIVPLAGDLPELGDSQLTNFLLVPYEGACIHTQLPPANQLVHVLNSQKFDSKIAYEAVWIEGIVKAGEVEGDLTFSGYSIDFAQVTESSE